MSLSNKMRISIYLTSRIKEGGDVRSKEVLGLTPRQTSLLKSRCPETRASLGAQREAVESVKTRLQRSTQTREGRVRLGKGSGKRMGLGPLEKWLQASKPVEKVPDKIEDEPDRQGGVDNLEPQVRNLRRLFEGMVEARTSTKGSRGLGELDPDLVLDPGK